MINTLGNLDTKRRCFTKRRSHLQSLYERKNPKFSRTRSGHTHTPRSDQSSHRHHRRMDGNTPPPQPPQDNKKKLRSASRNLSSIHNTFVWPLTSDLTIQVLSFIDAESVCYAAAACSFFHNCALDPSCFLHLDLTNVVPKIHNQLVTKLIQRAANRLQSIKLGLVPASFASLYSRLAQVHSITGLWDDKGSRQGKNDPPILISSCLIPLGASGLIAKDLRQALLRRFQLCNKEIDYASLCASLSACQSLRDLEIGGLHVELRRTLELVSKNCPLLERLSFEASETGDDGSLNIPTCNELVDNCPKITSLALRGFMLDDNIARTLVKGFRKMKYVDFSTSYFLTGAFLRNLGGGNHLEVLILRECRDLKQVEVEWFMATVLAGEFRMLKHLDISNRKGLESEGGPYPRCYSASFIPIKQLLEQRPNFCLVAEFPSDRRFISEASNRKLSMSKEDKSFCMWDATDPSLKVASNQIGEIVRLIRQVLEDPETEVRVFTDKNDDNVNDEHYKSAGCEVEKGNLKGIALCGHLWACTSRFATNKSNPVRQVLVISNDQHLGDDLMRLKMKNVFAGVVATDPDGFKYETNIRWSWDDFKAEKPPQSHPRH